MQKILLSFLLVVLLLFCFSQDQKADLPPAVESGFKAAEKIYQQAENLSFQADDNEELQVISDSLYQKALKAFLAITPALERAGNDSLLFYSLLRSGFIHYYFDSITEAKATYLAAISIKQRLSRIPDSLLFLPYLYTGGAFYHHDQFDSAFYYYKKAEQVNDSYPKPLSESQRLYNRLGVMYYEAGDYRQARNYFEKAIALLLATSSPAKSLLVNYKINIASILIKLEEYDQARVLYESILPYNIFTDEIYHNLGIIQLKQGDYKQALAYLENVQYTNNKKKIDLYYNFGMAFSGLKQADSANSYFNKALTENLEWNGTRNSVTHGLILQYRGDQLMARQKINEALALYQQSIIQFSTNFSETAVESDPAEFSGIFSYINLFNSLTRKADAFEKLYRQEGKIDLLKNSLAAYQAAFRLAHYVERTYDSDESRLFLGKIKHTVHNRPIEVGLMLYRLTDEIKYLEDVYVFDQQNKATALSLNIEENKLRQIPGKAGSLISKEQSIRSGITRLSLKAANLSDSTELAIIKAAIRDEEIALAKLRQQLIDDPAWRQMRSIENIPTVKQLQQKLDRSTGLLSYHLSPQKLVLLFISAHKFECREITIDQQFFAAIDRFRNALQHATAEQRYNGAESAASLYQLLIDPVQPLLGGISRLLIIPDDELHYLPFEALQDKHKKYLLENFSVQYHYSTALLDTDHDEPFSNILAFAPFASTGYADTSGESYSSLPASRSEVNNLKGHVLLDSSATKKNFLELASRYGVIHLATHASADNGSPLRSNIVFSPASTDYKLYASEIFNLRLDSADLVILSACETGKGQLIKGEGLMSLSRAFAYAGCPNIITSLWKAEDNSTAYLMQRLHHYLSKKYSKDKALQQAKLDLLTDNTVNPRFKSPDHWAHLLLVGNYQPDKGKNMAWLLAGIALLLLIYYFFKRKKPAV